MTTNKWLYIGHYTFGRQKTENVLEIVKLESYTKNKHYIRTVLININEYSELKNKTGEELLGAALDKVIERALWTTLEEYKQDDKFLQSSKTLFEELEIPSCETQPFLEIAKNRLDEGLPLM